MSSQLEVRSFRAVFALERRIYRVDTLRLNPGGVPLRGIAYAVALVMLALLAGVVPPASWLVDLVPWYIRDLAVPIAMSILLASLRLDGRPFHLAAASIGAFALGPRRLHRLVAAPRTARWEPPDLLVIPDGSDARFRALRFRGPGALIVRVAHAPSAPRAFTRADIVLRPLDSQAPRPTVVELEAGAVLEVRTR